MECFKLLDAVSLQHINWLMFALHNTLLKHCIYIFSCNIRFFHNQNLSQLHTFKSIFHFVIIVLYQIIESTQHISSKISFSPPNSYQDWWSSHISISSLPCSSLGKSCLSFFESYRDHRDLSLSTQFVELFNNSTHVSTSSIHFINCALSKRFSRTNLIPYYLHIRQSSSTATLLFLFFHP